MYGVKFGDMAKLVREIKQDHGLALELWDTGNHDARVLATMTACKTPLALPDGDLARC
jgi:3-methyladenine DNA glycosylase AlkD